MVYNSKNDMAIYEIDNALGISLEGGREVQVMLDGDDGLVIAFARPIIDKDQDIEVYREAIAYEKDEKRILSFPVSIEAAQALRLLLDEFLNESIEA